METKLNLKESWYCNKIFKKEEEKRIQEEAITVEKGIKHKKNMLKIPKNPETKLQSSSDFNGYIIKESNKDKIFNALYKPIRLEDGNITTDFNSRLSSVLNDPDKILFLQIC